MSNALPYLKKHPPGFTYKSIKITTTPEYTGPLNGDAVCAAYYEEYLEEYKIRREEAYSQRKPGIQTYELHIPYTKYPNEVAKVPVEAILGEVYLPQKDGRLTNIPGCYVACQDIRTTLEWILTAKLTNTMHVRVKIFFAFPCLEGQVARTTTRQSWREQETEEEVTRAIRYLKTFHKRTDISKLVNYELLLKGRTGEITGCECFYPTPEERKIADELIAELKRMNGGKRKSVARQMVSKKFKDRTNPGYRPPRLHTKATATAVSTLQDNVTQETPLSEYPIEAEIAGDDIYEGITLGGLNLNPAMTCYDFDFPVFETGFTDLRADAATVEEATWLLQVSFEDQNFDGWFGSTSGDPGSSSGKGK